MQTRQLVATRKPIVTDEVKHQIRPTKLLYYLTITHTPNGTARYGVGIEKITEDDGTILSEQKWLTDIFISKKLCQAFLNSLIQNIVFPTNLCDIVWDTIA